MKITSRILIVLFVSLTSSVGAKGLNFGLVKEGSFLLSRLPDKPKDGFRVHSLVGYLPVGTRVLIGTRKEVRNIKTSEKEIYYYVKSDIGVHGLLKEDLLIQSEGDKLAVSIASFAIPVHQPHATLENQKKRFDLGKYGGHYLRIVGESEPGFYDVILHRNHYEKYNLPQTERGRLKKFFVEKNLVSVLDPGDSSLTKEFHQSWRSLDVDDESFIKESVNKLVDKIGEDPGVVKSLLFDISNLQCLFEASLEGDLGFKIFSNGFSLGLDLGLKKKGIKYIFEANKHNSDSGSKYYSGLGVVQCDGITPVRLQSFTLQEGMAPTKRKFSVTLKELNQSHSKWITTLQDESISNKMVRISGWNEYNQLMKELNRYASSGSGYLSELTEKQRLMLLNYIVTRIGYFEHRELIANLQQQP